MTGGPDPANKRTLRLLVVDDDQEIGPGRALLLDRHGRVDVVAVMTFRETLARVRGRTFGTCPARRSGSICRHR